MFRLHNDDRWYALWLPIARDAADAVVPVVPPNTNVEIFFGRLSWSTMILPSFADHLQTPRGRFLGCQRRRSFDAAVLESV